MDECLLEGIPWGDRNELHMVNFAEKFQNTWTEPDREKWDKVKNISTEDLHCEINARIICRAINPTFVLSFKKSPRSDIKVPN